jgi:GNAT superfamily N-acetyltransferase
MYGREGSEPSGSAATAQDVAVFLVAYDDDGRAVGCGGIRIIDEGVDEVKRMYVDPSSRGAGMSTAILAALERWAIEHEVLILRLETGDLLLAAHRFYEREGYAPIPLFGPYIGSQVSRCYEKHLAAESTAS